jgi:hypothetical protein
MFVQFLCLKFTLLVLDYTEQGWRSQPSQTKATAISPYQTFILYHIRNPERLQTANTEVHPKSEPVTTQQRFAPELVNASFYINYILIVQYFN